MEENNVENEEVKEIEVEPVDMKSILNKEVEEIYK